MIRFSNVERDAKGVSFAIKNVTNSDLLEEMNALKDQVQLLREQVLQKETPKSEDNSVKF